MLMPHCASSLTLELALRSSADWAEVGEIAGRDIATDWGYTTLQLIFSISHARPLKSIHVLGADDVNIVDPWMDRTVSLYQFFTDQLVGPEMQGSLLLHSGEETGAALLCKST
jgi:hypothetical protein